MSNRDPVLRLCHLSKSFKEGVQALTVLKDINLEVHAGQVVSLLGPSGSGKSTLMHSAGLLERPDSGTIFIEGKEVSEASDGKRTLLRRQTMGFIYQFHHLLNEFTALENVLLPQLIQGIPRAKARIRSQELLEKVGLKDRLTHFPTELSGGEQQRVAIARALANAPKILLADEPTGNLDPRTSAEIFSMILNLSHEQGLAALVVTHNADLATQTDHVVKLEKGVLYRA